MNELTICDVSIKQDAEGRYCLNDLHKAAGGESRHQPGKWLSNKQTIELIAEYSITGIPVIEQKQQLTTKGTPTMYAKQPPNHAALQALVNMPKVTIPCKHCKTPFQTKLFATGNTQAIFCNRKCKDTYRSLRIPVLPADNLAGEIWSSFFSQGDFVYMVSNMARVKSVKSKTGVEKLLSPAYKENVSHKGSFYKVSCGRGNFFDLHSLVAKHFVPNPLKVKAVDFVDGDKRNCKADNLAWLKAISKDQQIENFQDINHIKNEHPDITDNIISYVLTGDKIALGVAWKGVLKHFRRYPTVLLRHLGCARHIDESDVEDIMQESLMAAQKQIDTGRLRIPDNIEGWIYGIIKHKTIDYTNKYHHISISMEEMGADKEHYDMYDSCDQDRYQESSYTPSWNL